MNLHRMKADLIAADAVEEFLKDMPGFVCLKQEHWEQIVSYMVHQKQRAESALDFMRDRVPGGVRADRIAMHEKRVENAGRMLQSLIDRKPLELEICNCWYAANPDAKHPSGFACSHCHNTGKVQLT